MCLFLRRLDPAKCVFTLLSDSRHPIAEIVKGAAQLLHAGNYTIAVQRDLNLYGCCHQRPFLKFMPHLRHWIDLVEYCRAPHAGHAGWACSYSCRATCIATSPSASSARMGSFTSASIIPRSHIKYAAQS